MANMLQLLTKPKELTFPSIILTFTFIRGDLRTKPTLDVGEDEPQDLRINVNMNPWDRRQQGSKG
jgi:hypothetical protein